jgi:hypothetical protein
VLCRVEVAYATTQCCGRSSEPRDLAVAKCDRYNLRLTCGSRGSISIRRGPYTCHIVSACLQNFVVPVKIKIRRCKSMGTVSPFQAQRMGH